jgi:NADH:ubiquinone oxidoreductase subunit E
MIVHDFRRILGRYPSSSEDLGALLQEISQRQGWLSPEILDLVATFVGRKSEELRALATAKNLPLKPRGKRHLQVCVGHSCKRHSAAILQELASQQSLEPGKTTPDGAISLETVDCLARCSCAPAARLDAAPIASSALTNLVRAGNTSDQKKS